MHFRLFFIFSLLAPFIAMAQSDKVISTPDSLKFHLKKKTYAIDPTAKAVYLYEKKHTSIFSGYSTETYEVAIKIINAQAAKELADVTIGYGSSGKIKKINAVTYYLEGDNVVENKVEKSDILIDNTTRDFNIKIFSLPNLKDGCIIKYSYTMDGNTGIHWNYQNNYPKLYSEYILQTLAMVVMSSSITSSVPLVTKKNEKELAKNDCQFCDYQETFHGENIKRTYVRRNIPAFKEEPLMGNPYLSREQLRYNITGFTLKGFYQPVVRSWKEYNDEKWMKAENLFGQAFQRNNFLDAIVPNIIQGTKDSLEMAKAIYYHIQENIRERSNEKYADIKGVYELKQGNANMINLLLVAMLKKAGFDSDPIYISEKGSVPLDPIHPNPAYASKIISFVNTGNKIYFLDGSERYLPFGYLHPTSYNGYSRIVGKEAGEVNLTPSMATEKNTVIVQVQPHATKANHYVVVSDRTYGAYEGMLLRKDWQKDSVALKNKFKAEELFLDNQVNKENWSFEFKNMALLDQPVKLHTEQVIEVKENVGTLFIDPYFFDVVNENPLPVYENRKFDIEFPYAEETRYYFTFNVGDRFTVDEHPTSTEFDFGNPVSMQYKNTLLNDTAQKLFKISTIYRRPQTVFPAHLAKEMHSFFGDIIVEQKKKIVLKRK